ncbi:hypothetical protein [Microbacterium istanbulense]|uniref:Uncharacterized protein n=1 Tax=Microbacterium istanbulense TaxID=3122049 RepID=A0ABU8LLJ2_9MICO
MPTGPLHFRFVNSFVNGVPTQESFSCRCMIGEEHVEGPDLQDYEPEPETFPFAGAEEIFDSSGRDEDYDFR